MDSIRRWDNNGKFTQTQLTKDEKATRKFYKTLLNLCRDEAALAKGEFFDLMYANHNNWLLNESKQYAFIRKYKNEALLIIANFGDFPMKVSVNLPQHAFDYLKMPCYEKCHAEDLLSGKTVEISFTYKEPTTIDLPASCGKILKIKLK